MIWRIFKRSHLLLDVGHWKGARTEGRKPVRKYSGIRETGPLGASVGVMELVRIGQILNIVLNIWASMMCSCIGCGVWEKRNQGWHISTSPSVTNPHTLETKWKNARYFTEMEEDWQVFVLDRPRVWGAHWINNGSSSTVKTGIQRKVKTGDTYWESWACVW